MSLCCFHEAFWQALEQYCSSMHRAQENVVPVAPQLAHGGMAGVSALTQKGAHRGRVNNLPENRRGTQVKCQAL